MLENDARAGAQRLARARCRGAAVPEHHQRAVSGGVHLRRRLPRPRSEPAQHGIWRKGCSFDNAPEAVFTGCLLLFLATMTLVTVSQHFGLLWVAVEATTLASAPLIYFHRHHRSLEATWKYLLICSVGIALALLGNFFLAVAAARRAGDDCRSCLTNWWPSAPTCNRRGSRRRSCFFFVGYGTKMGLGADAHLAAGRAQRGAVGRLGAAVRRAAELRVSRHSARRSRSASPPGSAAFRPGPAGWLSGCVSMAVARGLHPRPDGLQTDAGVFERRAHGHPRARRRPGRRGGVRRHAARGEPFADQGDAVPGRGQHPGRVPDEVDRRRCAACWRVLPVTGVLWLAGFLAITGIAAVRAVPERVHDPEGGARRGATSGRRSLYLALLARDLHRHGDDLSRAWRRACRRSRRPAREPRSLLASRAAGGARRAWSLCLGLDVPAAAERCCCSGSPRRWEAS